MAMTPLHATIGVAIAALIKQPWLAIPVAVLVDIKDEVLKMMGKGGVL